MSVADDLERRLSQQKGAKSDPRTADLPPGFADRLPTLSTADAVRQEQERLTREADRLFRQLGSADKETVQQARRRQIRTLINALRRLEQPTVP